MRDLLIITPTRGRPGNARRLAEAVAATCTADTELLFAVDDDDTSYDDLAVLEAGNVTMIRGPQATCGQWTNRIAAAAALRYRAFASLGDDHLPRTPGWDTKLLAAIDAMGGTGIAYGDDIGQGKDLPTAPVISSNIIAALGWMFYPGCTYLFCDNVWLDLGQHAGCLAYVPEVVVEHLHYTRRVAPLDATYEAAQGTWNADRDAYREWQRTRMHADVAKVRRLAQPAGWAGLRA